MEVRRAAFSTMFRAWRRLPGVTTSATMRKTGKYAREQGLGRLKSLTSGVNYVARTDLPISIAPSFGLGNWLGNLTYTLFFYKNV